MDLQSTLAAKSYAAINSAAAPVASAPEQAAAHLATSFADILREGEATSLQAMTGQADSHALVQALAQTELAVETAVSIRDKVVQAYQEILRMPV